MSQNIASIDDAPGDPGDEQVAPKRSDLEIDKLFRALVKLEGSDLHLKVGRPPYFRVRGSLRPMNRGPIEPAEMARLCLPLLDDRKRKIFDETGGVDFAHTTDVDGDKWRFRVNFLQQQGHMGMVARRTVNRQHPRHAQLNLPPIIEELCKYDQGMVLLAGVTGSELMRLRHAPDAQLHQCQLPQTYPDARRSDRIHLHRR